MKKLLLVVLLFFMIFMVGCEKENREVSCIINKDDKTISVTVSEVDGKVTISTNETELKCSGDMCSTTGNTTEEESKDSFDKVVEQYRKDGYSCEK